MSAPRLQARLRAALGIPPDAEAAITLDCAREVVQVVYPLTAALEAAILGLDAEAAGCPHPPQRQQRSFTGEGVCLDCLGPLPSGPGGGGAGARGDVEI